MRSVLERNSLVRNRALRLHGCTCQVCGFDYGARYGEIGRGFAEVHHLALLASSRGRIKVDVATDVAVLCANCHRMIHKQKPDPFTLDELRAQLRKS
jgi:5-methylcytosine-specific restriction protein A